MERGAISRVHSTPRSLLLAQRGKGCGIAASVSHKVDDALLMSLKTLSLCGVVILLTATGHAEEGWSLLKSGMNRADTATTLGDPLLKNIGRGFEVWLYDGGAEVLCFQGMVVAWTAPAGVKSPDGRQLDLSPFFAKPAQPSSTSPGSRPELDPIPVRQMRLPKL